MKPTEYDAEKVAAFKEAMPDSGVEALLVHAVYLVNCASEDLELREKSLASLIGSLRAGAALGAVGVVVHPGSALNEPRFDGLPCVFEGSGVAGKAVEPVDMAIAWRMRAEGLRAHSQPPAKARSRR